MTNDTFWLSRGPGRQAEGPFFLAQIQSMFESGQVTAISIVCPVGSKQWTSVADWVSAPQSFEEVLQDQKAETAISCRNALNIMSGALLVASLFPGLGIMAFGLYGIYALIALVLCIVMMTKGWTNTAINNLIKAFIVVPIAMVICQGLAIGALTFISNKEAGQIKSKASVEEVRKP